MKPETIAYIRYRVARAKETLQAAKLLFEGGHLHDTVSRLYYACFYIVSALPLTKGLYSAKHKGVQSLFNQHWINTGLLPRQTGRYYRTLFERRPKRRL